MRILTEDDLDPDWDQDDIIWCPICLERGYQNRLGGKILGPNDQDRTIMIVGFSAPLVIGYALYLQ